MDFKDIFKELDPLTKVKANILKQLVEEKDIHLVI